MKTHVKVTKMERLPDRPNGTLVGWDGDGEIVEGYWVLGYADAMPKMGQPFKVDRYSRNGVEVMGEFTTSPVQLISRNDDGSLGIKTENSIYHVEVI